MYVCPYCKHLNRPVIRECTCIGSVSFCSCKYCNLRFLPPLKGNFGRTIPKHMIVTISCIHSMKKEPTNLLVPNIDLIPKKIEIVARNGFDYQEYIHNAYIDNPIDRRQLIIN